MEGLLNPSCDWTSATAEQVPAETVCGALLIIGLLTRLAAIVLLIDISLAILSTKIPILLGHGLWRFSLAQLPRYGFWSMMHEARADLSMWLGARCRRRTILVRRIVRAQLAAA